jgi:outer membrane protein assembly factor BamD
LDQTETLRAIDRYRQFVQLYPENAHAAEAQGHLTALVDRLAEKRFRAGRLYARLEHRQAAAIYLRNVLTEYPQSRWAGDAAVLLAEVLVKQGKRDEAIAALRQVPVEATAEAKARARDQLRALGVAVVP